MYQPFRFVVCVLAVVGVILTTVQKPHAKAIEDQSCETIQQALLAHDKLKPGMTRAEVEKIFHIAGGMTFRGRTTYVYPKCEYITVDVEFEPDRGYKSEFSATDVVKKVGQLYIRYPAYD